MKNTIKILAVSLVILTLASCKQQQARMPISHSSGEFLNASVERNKKLIKGEEGQIYSIIKSNPNTKYIASQKGYWYYYDVKNDKDNKTERDTEAARKRRNRVFRRA